MQVFNELKREKTRDIWENGMSKEAGWLADKIPGKVQKGADNIRFFARNNIPVVHTVTYSHIVVRVRPQREDPIMVHLTVGGNCIEYPGKVSTKTEDLTTLK